MRRYYLLYLREWISKNIRYLTPTILWILSSILIYLKVKVYKIKLLLLSFFILILMLLFFRYLKYLEYERIEREFPDFLQALSFYIEIGFPIVNALKTVYIYSRKPLKKYISKIMGQMLLGKTFLDSLTKIGEEIKSIHVRRGVAILIESLKAGGEVSKTLQAAADIIREYISLRREREAKTRYFLTVFYIIFMVFAIVSVIIRKIIIEFGTKTNMFSTGINISYYDAVILTILILNSFFSGLLLGYVTKGRMSLGAVHSFALIVLSLTIYISGLMILD